MADLEEAVRRRAVSWYIVAARHTSALEETINWNQQPSIGRINAFFPKSTDAEQPFASLSPRTLGLRGRHRQTFPAFFNFRFPAHSNLGADRTPAASDARGTSG